MRNVLKWVAIAIVAFGAIRLGLAILLGILSFIASVFFGISNFTIELLNNINVTAITLIFLVGSFIVYFEYFAKKEFTWGRKKDSMETGKNTKVKISGTVQSPIKYVAENKKEVQHPLKKTPNDFVTFAKLIPQKILKELVDNGYSYLSETLTVEGNFGISGANEFVGSLILAEYQPNFKKRISEGHAKVFLREWSPLQFSDYMDEIVNSSEVPYEKWSEVYRYLEQNHKWIQQHDCAKEAKVIAPETARFVNDLFEGSLIDLDEVIQITDKAVVNLDAGAYKEAILKLKPLLLETSQCIVANEKIDFSNVLDQSYWHQLMLEYANVVTFFNLATLQQFDETKVQSEKYGILADLLIIAIVAIPREPDFQKAMRTLITLLAEVNKRRGILLSKEIEKIIEMPWYIDQAFHEVRNLILKDDVINRLKKI